MTSNALNEELLNLGLAFVLRWDMLSDSYERYAMARAPELDLTPEQALRAVRLAVQWLGNGHASDLIDSGLCPILRNGNASDIKALPISSLTRRST